jgi:exonuclease III
MKGMFWNVRGIRKKGVATYIRDMLAILKLDFICFQETILEDFSDKCLKSIDPNESYLWDWLSAKGKSGGVLSGINCERFDVGLRNQGVFILQHNLWDKEKEIKWNLMNVYGAPNDENRDAFLSELAAFCSKSKEPFLLGGDFNIIKYSYEKNKNFHPSRFISTFNAIIYTHELRGVHMSGGMFTWSNNQRDPTLEKLDRVLMSRGWEN